jgi:hypothetical protein
MGAHIGTSVRCSALTGSQCRHNGRHRIGQYRQAKLAAWKLAFDYLAQVMHSDQFPPRGAPSCLHLSAGQIDTAATEPRTPAGHARLKIKKALAPSTGDTSPATQAGREGGTDRYRIAFDFFELGIKISRCPTPGLDAADRVDGEAAENAGQDPHHGRIVAHGQEPVDERRLPHSNGTYARTRLTVISVWKSAADTWWCPS